MSWHPIELPSPLASREKVSIRLEDREILVCRVEDQYFALSTRCTHSAWPLVNEPIEGIHAEDEGSVALLLSRPAAL